MIKIPFFEIQTNKRQEGIDKLIWDNYTANYKMVYLKPIILQIRLNVNGQTTSTKRQRLSERIKNQQQKWKPKSILVFHTGVNMVIQHHLVK